MTKLRRSPLFYVGDKYKLLPEILTYFPKHIDAFYEPFVGGGSVFLNVDAKRYYVNDLEQHIIGLHEYLCTIGDIDEEFKQYELLIRHYDLSASFLGDAVSPELKQQHPKLYYAHHNRAGYNQLRDDFNTGPKTDYRRLYLLLIYGFNRMLRFNSKGEFNIPVGNVDFNKNVEQALRAYVERTRSLDLSFACQDYKDFLGSHRLGPEDFVYVDPPYLITFSEYNKYWSEAEEQALLHMLDELNERGVRFAISNVTKYKGRENTIFETWASQYNTALIKSNYISYHDNSTKQFTEVLVYNYQI